MPTPSVRCIGLGPIFSDDWPDADALEPSLSSVAGCALHGFASETRPV
jgi:hypothetical protein